MSGRHKLFSTYSPAWARPCVPSKASSKFLHSPYCLHDDRYIYTAWHSQQIVVMLKQNASSRRCLQTKRTPVNIFLNMCQIRTTKRKHFKALKATHSYGFCWISEINIHSKLFSYVISRFIELMGFPRNVTWQQFCDFSTDQKEFDRMTNLVIQISACASNVLHNIFSLLSSILWTWRSLNVNVWPPGKIITQNTKCLYSVLLYKPVTS